MSGDLDIVIPVFNEGRGIAKVLGALARDVRAEARVLLAYDHDDDDTLPVLRGLDLRFPIQPVKNEGRGVHAAVTTAFRSATAPFVLVWPADDDYNTGRVSAMLEMGQDGCEIVCASRFMRGGRMVGAPPLKALIVRSSAFVLHHLARLPTHDPSNGLRLFSLRLLRAVPLESTAGFTYSIELLVKCHRLGWRICEVPVEWHERTTGQSRFRVLRWLPAYFVWCRYAFATTFLRRGPETVRLGSAKPFA